MATVDETRKPFGVNLKEATVLVRLKEQYEPDGTTLKPIVDRIYVRLPDERTRSDGLELQYPARTVKLDDTIDTFDEGDAAAFRALLLKLWNSTGNVE